MPLPAAPRQHPKARTLKREKLRAKRPNPQPSTAARPSAPPEHRAVTAGRHRTAPHNATQHRAAAHALTPRPTAQRPPRRSSRSARFSPSAPPAGSVPTRNHHSSAPTARRLLGDGATPFCLPPHTHTHSGPARPEAPQRSGAATRPIFLFFCPFLLPVAPARRTGLGMAGPPRRPLSLAEVAAGSENERLGVARDSMLRNPRILKVSPAAARLPIASVPRRRGRSSPGTAAEVQFSPPGWHCGPARPRRAVCGRCGWSRCCPARRSSAIRRKNKTQLFKSRLSTLVLFLCIL